MYSQGRTLSLRKAWSHCLQWCQKESLLRTTVHYFLGKLRQKRTGVVLQDQSQFTRIKILKNILMSQIFDIVERKFSDWDKGTQEKGKKTLGKEQFWVPLDVPDLPKENKKRPLDYCYLISLYILVSSLAWEVTTQCLKLVLCSWYIWFPCVKCLFLLHMGGDKTKC